MVVGASIVSKQSQGAERRAAERTSVSLPVLIHAGGRQHVAKVHNLSLTGALLETAADLPRGASVVLSCGTIEANATIVWASHGSFGIRFAAPVRETVLEQQVKRSQAASARLHG
jgi:hypothetical protein